MEIYETQLEKNCDLLYCCCQKIWMCVCLSERYRIQSDSFEDMWLVVKELVQRFDQYFSKLGVKDFKKSFSGPLPLQEYFLSVDHHFQVFLSTVLENFVFYFKLKLSATVDSEETNEKNNVLLCASVLAACQC